MLETAGRRPEKCQPARCTAFCGEPDCIFSVVMTHSTLRTVLEELGPQALKIAPRGRGTAKTEIDFISAAAPEYLDRPALAAPAPEGEILVLVQCSQSNKWRI